MPAPVPRTVLAPLVGAALLVSAAVGARAAPDVIELTQTRCEFLEPEGEDHRFEASGPEDCKAINARTGEERVARSRVLRVHNRDVPWELGFWLRGDGLINRARLPSVSGGGITLGTTQEYVVDLEPGEYVYSCPLNPTPDYKLVVEKNS